MITIHLLLVILGLIFLAFAAFGVPAWRSVSWGWLGLLLLALAVTLVT